jgi:hypothetical protein
VALDSLLYIRSGVLFIAGGDQQFGLYWRELDRVKMCHLHTTVLNIIMGVHPIVNAPLEFDHRAAKKGLV